MLERYFVQQITKVGTVRNAYGDYTHVPANDVTMLCRIRPFVESARWDPAGEEERSPVMIAWFPPNTSVQENNVFLYEGSYYEVVRVREARKGRNNNIEFLKVSLNKHTMVS